MDTPAPLDSEQVVSRHEQIGQGSHHEQPVAVLGQTSIGHLGKAEHALDDKEGMLDLGPHLRLAAVLLTLPLGQRLVPAGLPVGEVLRARRSLADQRLLAGVGRVAIDPALAAMQQLRDRVLVMHVGRGGNDGVNQLGLAIDADVGLHAKVPLVALLGLAHLGIALAFPVLGRRRGVDDRRIDDGARADFHPVRLQMPADLLEQLLAQVMGFQQVTELADGGLVRGAFPTQVDADEVAHRQRVVEGFLDRRVGEVEPVLEKVDAQHALQANRRPAVAGLGIDRLDQRAQRRPRHHPIHLRQKRRAPCRLAMPVKTAGRKRHLFHRINPRVQSRRSDMTPRKSFTTYSDLP